MSNNTAKQICCKYAQKNFGGTPFDSSKDQYEHTLDLKTYGTTISCNNAFDQRQL